MTRPEAVDESISASKQAIWRVAGRGRTWVGDSLCLLMGGGDRVFPAGEGEELFADGSWRLTEPELGPTNPHWLATVGLRS